MKLWGDKPYQSLNYYLKEQYHEKIYKLSLNGGMTCPNRDGKISYGGCIFCSEGGSGDFAEDHLLSITAQIEAAKDKMHGSTVTKTVGHKYIAYFQAYTNTYAPVSVLRKLFYEAINHPDIVILSIATRPDCLDEEILDLLAELNEIKPVWVELGLQTMHEETAVLINRGYPLSCFETAVKALSKRNINTIVHVILGLPGETNEHILETVTYLNTLPIQGIKFQLLHVLKNTKLADYMDQIHLYSLEEYIALLMDCIAHTRPDIIIHRITGDGPKKLLLAPLWSSNKKLVLNSIHKAMKETNTWQGKYYKEV
ncbi:MAG: TIGR01212 family radical SAM protein [bacterium]|nr:TIGR01212 family radical SAM protein [bacterium]